MARGKAINVKIATAKVIKALETKLAEIEKNYANQEANEAKYEKARKAWQKEVLKSQRQKTSALTIVHGTKLSM
ncbi:MAG: hypothetical protein EBU16_04910 [Actinobacteria bacterium]|nr:hypothetical protein [Actinomycetota bacterium]